jgi:hypothetical protein
MSALPPKADIHARGTTERLLLSSRDVRFGSLADISRRDRHVRFTPESRHVRCNQKCLLWANSGHPKRFLRISDEHSSAGQNNPDFGELARLRIDLD